MDDAVESYYESALARHKRNPLSVEQVNDLACKVQAGDVLARRKLCDALAGIARAVSAKFSGVGEARGLSREDLQQEAMRAMLEALENWSPERGAFRNHAYSRARYAMLDVVNTGCLVKISKGTVDAIANGRMYDSCVKGNSLHTRAAAQMAMSTPASLSCFSEKGDPDLDIDYLESGYGEVEDSLTLAQILKGCRLTDYQKRCLAAKLKVGEETVRGLIEELGVCNQSVHNAADRALKNIRIKNRFKESEAA